MGRGRLTTLEANLRNCDFAVEGSPSSSTLMSPRRAVPSGSVCAARGAGAHGRGASWQGSVARGASSGREPWTSRGRRQGWRPPVPHLARASEEQAGDGALDVLRTKDVGRDAAEEQVVHALLLRKALKLGDLSLPAGARAMVGAPGQHGSSWDAGAERRGGPFAGRNACHQGLNRVALTRRFRRGRGPAWPGARDDASTALSAGGGAVPPSPLKPKGGAHVKLKRECESPASSCSDTTRM